MAVDAVDQAGISVAVVGGEYAGSNRRQCLGKLPRTLDNGAGIVTIAAQAGDLIGPETEDDDIVLADIVAHFDIGAIERADRQRAVEAELHVAGARGFHAGRRDLLGKVGGRNHDFRQRNVVVRHEDDFQQAAHGGVVVDDAGDVVDQLDDELRIVVARRRLAGEELDARLPVELGMRADLVVERHRFNDIQKLALVFVNALDLDVEHRIRIELNAHAAGDEIGELHLVGALDGGELFPEGAVAGELIQRLQLLGIVEEGIADGFAHEVRQAGIALHQPAARRDAVRLVVDAVRVELVQVGKDRDLHQVGMKGGNAVDRMRADEGKIAHAHATIAILVDQGDRADFGVAEIAQLAGFHQNLGVDRIDELHVAGQKPLEQRHGPAFQRLRQQGVVGVAEGVPGNIPGLVEFQAVDIDQQAHHFRDGDGRMGVVQLDRHLVGEICQIVILLQVTAQDVLQRGR